MTLISIFVSDILPIFVIAGVGFLLARYLQASVRTLAHVAFYALSPCLVFKLLVTTSASGPEAGRLVLLAVLITGAMGIAGRLAAIPLRLSRSELSAFLLVVMFSNGGNYGLPVVLFAFGPDALSKGTVYFVASSVLTYTVGVFLAAAGKRSVFRAFLGIAKVPAVYGVIAALLVRAAAISVPVGVMRPVGMLSDAALPLMVLVLGMQLERAKAPERFSVVSLAVALSLLVAPVLALGLTWLLDLSGTAQKAGIILASMPVAVITTVLALEFDIAPTFVSNAVFLSTLLSPFTLTPLIAYLQ